MNRDRSKDDKYKRTEGKLNSRLNKLKSKEVDPKIIGVRVTLGGKVEFERIEKDEYENSSPS